MISPRGTDPNAGPHALTFGHPDPPRLRCDTRQMYLAVAHYYRIIEDASVAGLQWKVATAGYSYILHGDEGKEMFAYQWHPQGPSPVTTPHVHLGPALGVADPNLPKVHVPTARVSLERVIRLAIELGAQPIKQDWDAILTQTESAFVQWRSWG